MNTFEIKLHQNQFIKFEFFLDNFYETVITIFENGAQVFKANVDTNPHAVYNGGTNSSDFDIDWSFIIQSKAERSGHLAGLKTNYSKLMMVKGIFG
jgi:hypothetical protein